MVGLLQSPPSSVPVEAGMLAPSSADLLPAREHHHSQVAVSGESRDAELELPPVLHASSPVEVE